MAAGKRLFEFVAKSLTRRSSDSVVVKSASSASEIRKAEEGPKLWLKDSRRQLKQDGEFGNRNRDGSDDFKRILLEAAYREYFHAFLTCACALGTPFAIFCVTKQIKNRNRHGSDDIKRILSRVAYREYFHAFLTCACALGTPFAIFCLAK